MVQSTPISPTFPHKYASVANHALCGVPTEADEWRSDEQQWLEWEPRLAAAGMVGAVEMASFDAHGHAVALTVSRYSFFFNPFPLFFLLTTIFTT